MPILWDEGVESVHINSVHIGRAVYCANCEMITDSVGDKCIICGSKSLESIERMLRRQNGYCQVARNSSTR